MYIINQLYIAKFDVFAYITIINPISGKVVGENPKHILYNPSNHKVYITKYDPLGIIVIDTSKDG